MPPLDVLELVEEPLDDVLEELLDELELPDAAALGEDVVPPPQAASANKKGMAR